MDRAERQSHNSEHIESAAHQLTTLSGLLPTYP
jgi:hypothetical protein